MTQNDLMVRLREYGVSPFIAMAPWSTLVWSGSTWEGPFNELLYIQIDCKQMTYAKLNS